MRRLRYRLLAAVSGVVGKAATTRRVALGVFVAGAVVFGVWGWTVFGDQRLGQDIDAVAVLHGTIGIFDIGAEVEPLPWQLDVARVLGPLATAGVLLEVIVVAGATRLGAFVARRASGHVVALGPADRTRPHLLGADTDGRPAVHVGIGDDVGSADAIHVRSRNSRDGWIGDSSATAARKVVVATGRDDINLGALATAIDAGIPADGAELVVEVDDRPLALRLAVALAVDRPAQAIEIICVRESHARFVAGDVLRTVEERGADGEIRLAIIGDSAVARAAVDHVAVGLRKLGSVESRTVPWLVVIDPDDAVAAERRSSLDDPSRLRVQVGTDRRALLSVSPPGVPLSVFVDFSDPERTSRTAVELACMRPGSTLWVAGDEPVPVPGSTLRTVSLGAASVTGQLLGPFGHLAQLRQDAAMRRGLTDRDWAAVARSDGARADAIGEARALVGELARRMPVVPASELAWGEELRTPKVMLDRATLEDLADLDRSGLDDLPDLLENLHVVGLVVPNETRP